MNITGVSRPKPTKTAAPNSTSPADGRGAPRKPRGRPSTKARKREELIDGATALFNARGISATSLTDVADVLDLSRATVYYYVSDRTELVFQCYMRACELAAEDLAQASLAANGFARVATYIRRALTPDRPPVAVMTEINSLTPDIASLIRKANDRNVTALVGFIAQGIDDGSIRRCDPIVVAQAIIGMLAWSQLLPQWSDQGSGPKLRHRAMESMIDLLTSGLAADRAMQFECPVSAEQFQPKIENIFDRKESANFKVAQLLATASALFNRNGIEATSLDEIAAAMGLTKGAVYHYLDDKADLVEHCYERSFELYDRFVDAAHAHGGNGLEAAMINAHLNIQAQAGTLSPLMPQPGFEGMPKTIRDRLHRRASSQNSAVARALAMGAAEGVARECDAPLVTHMCAGAFGWLPKWLPVVGGPDPFDIADAICDLLLRGLTPEPAD
ncbi:TetR family transcriptional regulator [Sphingopyxis panaciterrulae]|uniref:AcrR family transcriptional regulator n=1 Tax=Sphingopyxis panaciterrulae TaxID=462372 RepID=A0A7W9B318_9SPHN|nr:AcrR family transcriptional regulator [Sphingopyxis panaciterrulae]